MRKRTIAVIVGIVAAAVVALVIVIASQTGSDKHCVSKVLDVSSDQDRPADEALSAFVASQEEGPVPLTGWSRTSDSPDGTVFTSNVGGHWEVTVRKGEARSYSGCSS